MIFEVYEGKIFGSSSPNGTVKRQLYTYWKSISILDVGTLSYQDYHNPGISLYLTFSAYSEYPFNSLWSVLSSNNVRITINKV